MDFFFLFIPYQCNRMIRYVIGKSLTSTR